MLLTFSNVNSFHELLIIMVPRAFLMGNSFEFLDKFDTTVI